MSRIKWLYNPLNITDMYLVQQATRLIHTWTKDEQVVSDILSSFIDSNSDLVDSCTENPNPALEVVLLYKLDSFTADYLEKKSNV